MTVARDEKDTLKTIDAVKVHYDKGYVNKRHILKNISFLKILTKSVI